MTGWPWPLDGVQEWFEGLWNGVLKWVSDAGTVITTFVWDKITWVKDRIFEGLTWVWDQVRPALESVVGTILAPFNNLRDFLYRDYGTFMADLEKRLAFVPEFVRPAAVAIFAIPELVFSRVVTFVWDKVTWLRDRIGEGWASLSTFVWDKVVWMRDQVTDGLSWLKDRVVDVGVTIQGGFVTAFQEIAGKIGGAVADGLGKVVGFIREQFVPWITYWLGVVKTSVVDPAVLALRPLWNDITGYFRAGMESFVTALVTPGHVDPETAKDAVPTLLLQTTALGVGVAGIVTAAQTKVMGTGLDLSPVTNMIMPLIPAALVANAYIGTAISVGYITPLRYYYNSIYTPLLPGTQDLIRFLVREVISVERFTQIMAYEGYAATWAEAYWDAHWIIPTAEQATSLVNRGQITEDQYIDLLKVNDVHPDWVSKIASLRFIIPGVGDLIRFVTREVITYEDFEALARSHALSPTYAKMFWDAHWVLPPLDRVYNAFHRGLVNEDYVKNFLVLADYDSKYHSLLLGTVYTLFPRTDLRYAWETGTISDDDLVRYLRQHGFTWEDAGREATVQKRRVMESELNSIRLETINDFVEGFVDEDTLEANLAATGLRTSLVDYRVEAAKLKRQRNEKREQIANLKTLFLRGGYAVSDALADLKDIGLTTEEATSTVTSWQTLLKPVRTVAEKRPQDDVTAQLTLNERYAEAVIVDATAAAANGLDVREVKMLLSMAAAWNARSAEELAAGRVDVALDMARYGETIIKSADTKLRGDVVKAVVAA